MVWWGCGRMLFAGLSACGQDITQSMSSSDSCPLSEHSP